MPNDISESSLICTFFYAYQFAAQYVLRAASERRAEREALLAAAAMNINMTHFASTMSTMTTGTMSGTAAGDHNGGGGGCGGGGGQTNAMAMAAAAGGINCSPTGK